MFKVWFRFFGESVECCADAPTLEQARDLWDLLNGDNRILMTCTRP